MKYIKELNIDFNNWENYQDVDIIQKSIDLINKLKFDESIYILVDFTCKEDFFKILSKLNYQTYSNFKYYEYWFNRIEDQFLISVRLGIAYMHLTYFLDTLDVRVKQPTINLCNKK